MTQSIEINVNGKIDKSIYHYDRISKALVITIKSIYTLTVVTFVINLTFFLIT